MDIHARTTKWSKGISEMDVLSFAEKEIVCNKVAKQLFVICVTMATLLLIVIIAGMFEYPWLLDHMTNTANTVSTAHSQAGRSRWYHDQFGLYDIRISSYADTYNGDVLHYQKTFT